MFKLYAVPVNCFRTHPYITKSLTDCQLCSERYDLFGNNNWTEWSTIQGVPERVISNTDDRKARGRFEISSTITP